jgi:hypothetical protein
MSAVSLDSLFFDKGDIVLHHKTGGLYIILGLAYLESEPEIAQVLYIKCDMRGYVAPNAKVWVRPKTQMYDGRFSLYEPYSNRLLF